MCKTLRRVRKGHQPIFEGERSHVEKPTNGARIDPVVPLVEEEEEVLIVKEHLDQPLKRVLGSLQTDLDPLFFPLLQRPFLLHLKLSPGSSDNRPGGQLLADGRELQALRLSELVPYSQDAHDKSL